VPAAHALLTDLVLVESPRWHDGRLWFCRWGPHEIAALDLDGTTEVLPLGARTPSTGCPTGASWSCRRRRTSDDCCAAGSRIGRALRGLQPAAQ
jgi:hypothetical protein